MVQKNIGYPNGDPRNASGSFRGIALRPEAAGALDALNFYYLQRFGRDIGVSEGMRDLAGQNFYWDRFVNRRPGWTVAARPGTSNHGWGLAVDLSGPLANRYTEEHRWIVANAPLFGWEWTGVNFDEDWHFDYTGINVTAAQVQDYIKRGNAGGSKNEAPQNPIAELTAIGDEMFTVQVPELKRIYLVTPNGVRWLKSMDAVRGINAITGRKTVSVPFKTFWAAWVDINNLNNVDSALVGDQEVRDLAKKLGL